MKNDKNKQMTVRELGNNLPEAAVVDLNTDGESASDDMSGARSSHKKRARVLCGFLFVFLGTLLSFCLLYPRFLSQKGAESVMPEAPSEAVEAWRGAFESAETSERAMEICVGVRLGAAGGYGELSASGFVISEDGWIATADTLVASGQRGRLYVSFFDGREYVVETVVRDRESSLAFLKIDTSKTRAAEAASVRELHIGEELIAVGFERGAQGRAELSVGIFSGGVAQALPDGERLSTDLSFESSALGCPIFDSGGRAVGMATDGSGKILAISYVLQRFDELVSGR